MVKNFVQELFLIFCIVISVLIIKVVDFEDHLDLILVIF